MTQPAIQIDQSQELLVAIRLRGVLRGILMLQPMPCPHTVVATEAEGVSWIKARLWTDQVRRMKGSPP